MSLLRRFGHAGPASRADRDPDDDDIEGSDLEDGDLEVEDTDPSRLQARRLDAGDLETGALTDAELIDAELSAGLRDQAGKARQCAEDARQRAGRVVADAQAEAARLVAAAQAEARTLTASARDADRAAEAAEARAAHIDHARSIAERITEAEEHVGQLVTEHAMLVDRIAALTSRLGELGRQREDTAVELAAARDAGDVDAVAAAFARQRAIDEVVGTLTGQHSEARGRWNAIGETGWGGEYDRAVADIGRLRAQLHYLLNLVDPTRPDRDIATRVNDFARALAAVASRQQPAQRQPTAVQVVVRPDGTTVGLAQQFRPGR